MKTFEPPHILDNVTLEEDHHPDIVKHHIVIPMLHFKTV
jgi:hypothetical protein